MSEKRWRLVCYDVRDPRRYRELYKVIRGHGKPVQYSIFRCLLDDRQLESLRFQLSTILDPVDRLLVVDLCPRCAGRVISKNHVDGWEHSPSTFSIVGGQASAAEDDEHWVDDAQDVAMTSKDVPNEEPDNPESGNYGS